MSEEQQQIVSEETPMITDEEPAIELTKVETVEDEKRDSESYLFTLPKVTSVLSDNGKEETFIVRDINEVQKMMDHARIMKG